MVEQAVQTAPLAAAAQRKGGGPMQAPGRQPVQPGQRSTRGGGQLQKENLPTGRASSQPGAGKTPSQNTANQKQKSKQGSRRSRNRSRGQLLVKNSKATTLQFESDFDFESANAQFKDDITKEISGVFERAHVRLQLDGQSNACVSCDLQPLTRWNRGRPRTVKLSWRTRTWATNTTTKPSASLTTFHQT